MLTLSRRDWLIAMMGMAAMPFPSWADERGASVVATHFAVVQTLLAMGLVPSAMPLKSLYAEICVEPAAPASVVDIGLANEPNVELLLDLAPDAIVIGDGQERLVPLFERFSTVVATKFSRPDPRPYDLAVRETRALATRLGLEDRAAHLIDEAQAAILRCRARLNDYRRPVYVATLMPDGRHATIWGPGSLVHDVLHALGIENAWRDPVQKWGASRIGVERLAIGPDAALVYVDNSEAELALRSLSRSPLWTNLPFVREGRVAPLPRFFLYGGLPAAVRCAQGLASALSSLAARRG